MKLILLFFFLISPALATAQAQDCTVKYLGVNSGQEEEGEPNVEVDPHVFHGISERVNSEYQSTNVIRVFSLDAGRTLTVQDAVINVFEFTCVAPE
tara:strand:+ start:423 stop:710 length:288 start_codon:yes stop_codon:yes gene_type:complete